MNKILKSLFLTLLLVGCGTGISTIENLENNIDLSKAEETYQEKKEVEITENITNQSTKLDNATTITEESNKTEVPETVVNSIDDLNSKLIQASKLVSEIDENSSNIQNINFSSIYNNNKQILMDIYLESRLPVLNISYYNFIENKSANDELYNYIILYQDAFKHFINSVYGTEEYIFNSEQYYGAKRRVEQATKIYNQLKSSYRSDGTKFDINMIQVNDTMHPMFALDALWASNLMIRGMMRERLNPEHDFSKIPLIDAVYDMNKVVYIYKSYHDYLLEFHEKHNILNAQKHLEKVRSQSEDRLPYVINSSYVRSYALSWERSIENMWVILKSLDNQKESIQSFDNNFPILANHEEFLNDYFNSRDLLIEQELLMQN